MPLNFSARCPVAIVLTSIQQLDKVSDEEGRSMAAYKVRSGNYTFFFSYDSVDPKLLHIYARHLMQPADAVEIFFKGTTSENAAQERMETYTGKCGLYWFWLYESAKKVWVISCFNI